MKVRSSHLEAEMVGLARILCPSDFQRTSNGLPLDRDRNNSYFAKCSVHWTSTGLLLDTQWTSKQKRCKTVLSVQSAILINKSEKRQYILHPFKVGDIHTPPTSHGVTITLLLYSRGVGGWKIRDSSCFMSRN